jgi:hypothetical protein
MAYNTLTPEQAKEVAQQWMGKIHAAEAAGKRVNPTFQAIKPLADFVLNGYREPKVITQQVKMEPDTDFWGRLKYLFTNDTFYLNYRNNIK